MVTTNVCARGIDVEQVTLVVNFDLPMTKVTSFLRHFKQSKRIAMPILKLIFIELGELVDLESLV